ncbi:2,4-dihydroxyhept-2-ene-1,7-dioic acid aldolase [Mameliella alba]|jgi:4-hydroxy-2-oxoheptanedioate aldolase|uniref:HpcH/HpaI aldolase family protein n=1 Tax=Mameliella TaxID=1434019 RepID=UPI000841112E|nr:MULTISPECIES: aldolase/citrate lyase family protein [Mameliella]MBV6635388.1 4-hydroxy-2-oxo-heptane-1,7-dioate aldolase [Mameliella sp.]MCR9273078.1 HpcH/HpaI aldolase/citrate lyase family protein [Paracoccaceae bacterium]ODM45966.1 4-hydroxy-2-oxo-heptane-1,7-dioate aldolase [Ruegeria sp. PBVC088]MDD9731849.1 aldolase/citrate lyase family protein [Mameliella sp. AT18]OWV47003.1 4-hydroxy-2-oxo-heptane-1,7-dioate aldolase [Mameliella alba]
MELKKNAFKAGLQEGRLQRGIWCCMTDPLAAEMMATCGYDWMLFDCEHSPMDPIRVLPMLQAVAPYPVSALARPASLNAPEMKRLLDIGAQTLVVPYVQNAEEAAEAAAAVAYPPAGIRGVAGMTRASSFGRIADYHATARDELCLIVQVETVEAMAQIEAIAAVPGIDGIFIGPADLAASMGYPGKPTHPEVQAAVVDGIKRITAAGKPAGTLTTDPEFGQKAIDAGVGFIAQDLDLVALRKGLSRS